MTKPCEAPAGTEAPAAARALATPRQLRPIVVPASLDDLHGPSSGLVMPPRRLWWSGEEDVKFDLGNRSQAELWPELGMRRATRQAWEAAHPVLAAAAASGRVA